MCFIRIIFNKKKKLNEYLHDDSMFFMHDLFFVFKKYIKTIYTMLKKFYFNFQIYQYKSLSISVHYQYQFLRVISSKFVY